MDIGCVLRAAGPKGTGVFATRSFECGEIVIAGATVYKAKTNDAYAVQTGLHEFGYEEGIGSTVDHSCDPNCGARLTYTGVFDLVARRPIPHDEEITVDYAMRNYVVEHFPYRCLCGSPICRGLITGWKDLPANRREAYMGSVAPYLIEIGPRSPQTSVALGRVSVGEDNSRRAIRLKPI